ncbi:hypothetical protein A5790_05290 [Mycobacterium sp. 852002-51152_SCH6134967]|nr:hypothetical protein A5790_05290 [Mycobacterium sp. 852002-51152_SCH6134967]
MVEREACWLVAWFASRVLERDNKERQRLGKTRVDRISDLRRLAGWVKSARVFLCRPNPPTLEQVCHVIDCVFDEHDGHLPIELVNEFSPTGRTRPKDFRLTRLIQIFSNWDRLVEVVAMPMCGRPSPQPVAVDGPAPGQIPVPDLDAKVANLVDLFETFCRSRDPEYELDEFSRANWSKTFKIALRQGHPDFASWRLVIETLADPDIDEFVSAKDRYIDPFTLKNRFAEAFDHVQFFRDLKVRHPERFDKTQRRPKPEVEPVTIEQMREIGFEEGYIERFLERRHRAESRQRTWCDDDEVEHVTAGDVLACSDARPFDSF